MKPSAGAISHDPDARWFFGAKPILRAKADLGYNLNIRQNLPVE
jgi:hypothetical protein